jgi:tRNA pseudouridine55 synthase
VKSGLLLVDKPVGPSSFAVIRSLRPRLGRKVGHAGTLDPRASGLLLVLYGQATRLARYLVGLDKRYVTAIRLGQRTSTGDAEGDVIETGPAPRDIEEAVRALVGEVELPVPAASAVKIAGERAYRLHRRGLDVEMPVRISTVHDARILRASPEEIELELHVGSGTYVRSIADALGGHCLSLRRTAVGPFLVEHANDSRPLSPREALAFLGETELADDELGAVLAGRPVPRPGAGRLRLVYGGELVAVARAGGGLARPETVLRSSRST